MYLVSGARSVGFPTPKVAALVPGLLSMSLFDEGRDLLSKVHSADSGRIQTNRFLDVCRLVLQAVGKSMVQEEEGELERWGPYY